jgi:hypothetical protein
MEKKKKKHKQIKTQRHSLLACSFVFICKCGSSIHPYTDMHNDRESCKYSGVQGLFFSKNLRMKKPGMPEAKESLKSFKMMKIYFRPDSIHKFFYAAETTLLLQLKCFHMDCLFVPNKLPFYCNNNDNSYCRGNSSKMLKVFSSVILLCILMWLFTRCQG